MEASSLPDRLAQWAATRPDKPAVHLVDGDAVETLSYRALDARANRFARWLVDSGLDEGQVFAALMENRLDAIAIAWAARRAGLYFTPIGARSSIDEIAYLLDDSGARMPIATRSTAARAPDSTRWAGARRLVDGDDGEFDGFAGLARALNAVDPDEPLPVRCVGRDFLYSSGTTGRPKGIKRPLTPYADRFREAYDARLWREDFGFGEDTVYLTMAPMHHAAPLRSAVRATEFGGTSVIAGRFDPVRALETIERFHVTHSQWVPTMMIRMLALPDAVRRRADLSSMRVALHAAAPCPPEVKRRMIDWWGPVWIEYYGGSEGVGLTAIDSDEWLRKPGSVGRARLGTIHIKDEDGRELPAGVQGRIWFSGTPPFEYHNDPAKTATARDESGCATFGDIGHLDEDGYLFISGRRTDLILTGGVNVYPQEVEHLLATYPGVADVAVIGVAHPDLGQEVKAVVELEDARRAGPELAGELIAYCRERIAHVKCPRSVDFVASLPRNDGGKLFKRELIRQYEERGSVGA